MTRPPAHPKIYHITHIDNLASIVALDRIESDSRRIQKGNGQTSIGMTAIKRRRLDEIAVSCHRNTMVGEYVPFYFCPRSIMLYILHMGNRVDLTHYHRGQAPVLHLQADMDAAINWANQNGVSWAFSDRNAGSYCADFYNSRDDLDKINWEAVESTNFRDPLVKEGKQAEFLLHNSCPWGLVEKIGVFNERIRNQTIDILQAARHKPVVTIEKAWYY